MNKSSNISVNSPDETWDPLSFLSQADLKEIIETKKQAHLDENAKKIDDQNHDIYRQNFF